MSITRRALRCLVLAAVATAATTGGMVPAATAWAQPDAAAIEQEIEEESARLTRVVEDYNRVREELKATKRAIAAVEEKLKPLRGDLAHAQTDVETIAIGAYKTGNVGPLSALLSSGSTTAFFDRLNALNQVAKTQQNQLATFSATLDRYEQRQRELDELLAAQDAKRKNLAAKKDALEADIEKLYELRRQIYTQEQEEAAAATAAAARASAPNISGKAGIAVQYAYDALGKPYVWAAEGPDGYDCSGLTLAAWRAAGVSLPHNAAMQWDVVVKINRSDLAPGDLIFYNDLGHVAIYVGDGMIIQASTFGVPVNRSSMDSQPIYGYGRVQT